MVDKTVGINENISSQGAAMEEINANIEELSAMSETINQISSGLSGWCSDSFKFVFYLYPGYDAG